LTEGLEVEQRLLWRFLLGVLVYSAGDFFASSYSIAALVTVARIIAFVGLCVSVVSAFKISRLSELGALGQILVILLVVWGGVMVGHSFVPNYYFVYSSIFGAANFLLLALPLLCSRADLFYGSLNMKYFRWELCALLLFFLFLNSQILHGTSSDGWIKSFGELFVFYFLVLGWGDLKKRVISLVILLVFAGFAIVNARRNLVATFSMDIFAFLLLQTYQWRRKLHYAYFTVLGAVAVLFIAFHFNVINFSGFDHLKERADEDTRSGVEKMMISDMRPMDWIIGKGVAGGYKAISFDMDSRQTIETGWLQLALNGGIIYAGLFCVILLIAIPQGLFFSRNIYVKSAALYLLIWTIQMKLESPNITASRMVLFWCSVGFCLMPQMCNKSDEEMTKHLFGSSCVER